MKTLVLVIDYQQDFCKPSGTLFVPGANDDVVHGTNFLKKYAPKIDFVLLTLDSHYPEHIAHARMWEDNKHQHPNPFTIITETDVANGTWLAANPGHRAHFEKYVQSLKKNNSDDLTIWPDHCLIGTLGHAVVPEFMDAVLDWSRRYDRSYKAVTKGSNVGTEHYGAVEADVPDDRDPSTKKNVYLIDKTQQYDRVIILGQASSHCVFHTLGQMKRYGLEHVKKWVILKDTMSAVPVPIFVDRANAFFKEMEADGALVTTTKDFLF